uniref:Uncharacterized protein n=1 Tax=Clandestinovirus TaxID=2831644 RepID=A0A8F8KNY9_9VIRU|nr:hypothetical protein KOM_12_136 [Clandestinovirus]
MNGDFGYLRSYMEGLLVPAWGNFYPSAIKSDKYAGLIHLPYVKKVENSGVVILDGVIDNLVVHSQHGPVSYKLEIDGREIKHDSMEYPIEDGETLLHHGKRYAGELAKFDEKYAHYRKFYGDAVKIVLPEGHTPMFVSYDEINVWVGMKDTMCCALRFAR